VDAGSVSTARSLLLAFVVHAELAPGTPPADVERAQVIAVLPSVVVDFNNGDLIDRDRVVDRNVQTRHPRVGEVEVRLQGLEPAVVAGARRLKLQAETSTPRPVLVSVLDEKPWDWSKGIRISGLPEPDREWGKKAPDLLLVGLRLGGNSY
jgi:hypothetical protein